MLFLLRVLILSSSYFYLLLALGDALLDGLADLLELGLREGDRLDDALLLGLALGERDRLEEALILALGVLDRLGEALILGLGDGDLDGLVEGEGLANTIEGTGLSTVPVELPGVPKSVNTVSVL